MSLKYSRSHSRFRTFTKNALKDSKVEIVQKWESSKFKKFETDI